MARKKVGRPRFTKGEAMSKTMLVRFTVLEMKAIKSIAEANTQTVSEWVRSVLRNAARRTLGR